MNQAGNETLLRDTAPARRARWPVELSVGTLIVAAFIALIFFPGVFATHAPDTVDVDAALQSPSEKAWFGTDDVGRDIYSRVVHGTRITLGLVAGALLLAALAGSVLGLAAGFLRGTTDMVLGRAIDVVLSFPPIVLGVIITGVLGPGPGNLVLALSVVYLPLFFRIARSGAIEQSARPYIEAAHALGMSRSRVLFRHLTPNVLPLVLLQYTMLFPLALQIEAALGFLGLGIQPPTPDWGAILEQGKNFILVAPWMTLYPGIFLLLAALGASLSGRGLQRLLDED